MKTIKYKLAKLICKMLPNSKPQIRRDRSPSRFVAIKAPHGLLGVRRTLLTWRGYQPCTGINWYQEWLYKPTVPSQFQAGYQDKERIAYLGNNLYLKRVSQNGTLTFKSYYNGSWINVYESPMSYPASDFAPISSK